MTAPDTLRQLRTTLRHATFFSLALLTALFLVPILEAKRAGVALGQTSRKTFNNLETTSGNLDNLGMCILNSF